MEAIHQHLVTRKGIFVNGDYLTNGYKNWIINRVSSKEIPVERYSKLLDYLFHRDFTWYVRSDENRAGDALHLRQEYEDEENIFDGSSFHDQQVNVLEVLAALAIRCEYEIMGEPGEENPSHWFWLYLQNLGLMEFDDDHFNYATVDFVVGNWIHRRYNHDGFGGIFPVENCVIDQRRSELWLQMHQYLLRNYPVD